MLSLVMALLASRGFETPSLSAQDGQRRSRFLNIRRDIPSRAAAKSTAGPNVKPSSTSPHWPRPPRCWDPSCAATGQWRTASSTGSSTRWFREVGGDARAASLAG
jgi:hypothetical protein